MDDIYKPLILMDILYLNAALLLSWHNLLPEFEHVWSSHYQPNPPAQM